MALALTILAIALASLALGVQLADLRMARGTSMAGYRTGARPRRTSGMAKPTASAKPTAAVTEVRPKIVPASVTRRCAHR